MKPVFKCDYCSEMGTEEEIKEHEIICIKNYNRKNCYTCVHKNMKLKNEQYLYECKAGKEIPEGKIFEFCNQYERKTEEKANTLVEGLFNGLFGW